jgi:hypothetical protein
MKVNLLRVNHFFMQDEKEMLISICFPKPLIIQVSNIPNFSHQRTIVAARLVYYLVFSAYFYLFTAGTMRTHGGSHSGSDRRRAVFACLF